LSKHMHDILEIVVIFHLLLSSLVGK
jgi:hypothetical protein